MTEWAGDRKTQQRIVRQIMKRYRDVSAVDMAGVAETILCNLVNDNAASMPAALAGIDAIAGDMKDTIIRARAH